MKTILTRAKTLVNDNRAPGQTLEYVKGVEVVHPEIELTTITIPSIPKIIFTPVSTSEEWVASLRKNSLNVVMAYLILQYHQRESSIISDATRPSGQGKGITDFVSDFISVFRGHRFAVDGVNYLDKPLDITNIDYADPISVDNGHLIVAAVTMECSRLLTQVSLPGNV